jgi:PAS domain S-box-containing protein
MTQIKKPSYQDLENQILQLKLANKLLDHHNLLLKASEDIITIHNPNGKYLYYNGPTCYEVSPEDIVGKMPHDLFNKKVSDGLMEAFNKVKNSGRSESIEVHLDWLGQKKWFSEYIYPFKNDDGEVVEIVKVCRDITSLRLLNKRRENKTKRYLKARDLIEML